MQTTDIAHWASASIILGIESRDLVQLTKTLDGAKPEKALLQSQAIDATFSGSGLPNVL